MTNFYKLLETLQERKIPFCFQCQGKNNYFNLSVEDPKGLQHSFSAEKLEHIDRGLQMMWGHLLEPLEVKMVHDGIYIRASVTIPSPSITPLPRPF